MNILVVVASKHGSTLQVADEVADELRSAGNEVTVAQFQDNPSLDGVDVVVVGSAIYMTQWMDSARSYLRENAARLKDLPVWAFSTGLTGVPMGNVQDPRRVGPAILAIKPVEYVTFKGALDFGELDLRERSIARLGNAPEGDYREWDRIRAWARQIAASL